VLSGCSIVTVHGPTRRPNAEPCTASYTLPTIDLALAGAGLGIAAIEGAIASIPGETVGPQDECANGCSGRTAFLVTAALLSLPFVINSAVGYSRVHACRAANESSAMAAR
jgi:hypothetical protein